MHQHPDAVVAPAAAVAGGGGAGLHPSGGTAAALPQPDAAAARMSGESTAAAAATGGQQQQQYEESVTARFTPESSSCCNSSMPSAPLSLHVPVMAAEQHQQHYRGEQQQHYEGERRVETERHTTSPPATLLQLPVVRQQQQHRVSTYSAVGDVRQVLLSGRGVAGEDRLSTIRESESSAVGETSQDHSSGGRRGRGREGGGDYYSRVDNPIFAVHPMHILSPPHMHVAGGDGAVAAADDMRLRQQQQQQQQRGAGEREGERERGGGYNETAAPAAAGRTTAGGPVVARRSVSNAMVERSSSRRGEGASSVPQDRRRDDDYYGVAAIDTTRGGAGDDNRSYAGERSVAAGVDMHGKRAPAVPTARMQVGGSSRDSSRDSRSSSRGTRRRDGERRQQQQRRQEEERERGGRRQQSRGDSDRAHRQSSQQIRGYGMAREAADMRTPEVGEQDVVTAKGRKNNSRFFTSTTSQQQQQYEASRRISEQSHITGASGLAQRRLPTQLKLDLLDELRKEKKATQKQREERRSSSYEQKVDKAALLMNLNRVQNRVRGHRTSGVWFQYTDERLQGFNRARIDGAKAAEFLLLNAAPGASPQRKAQPHITSGTTSQRLHRRGRSPEDDVKKGTTTESAAAGVKSRRRSSNKRRRSGGSEGMVKRRGDERRTQHRGGLEERERQVSFPDPKRFVNNKLIDPLDFKAPPKKKKLADTDWAKYGRPAPRIRKEDRMSRGSKLDDEALGIVSRALDNVYRIVVGSPRTDSSSITSDRVQTKTAARAEDEKQQDREDSLFVGENEGETSRRKSEPQRSNRDNSPRTDMLHNDGGREAQEIAQDTSDMGIMSPKIAQEEHHPLPVPRHVKDIKQLLDSSCDFKELGRPKVKRPQQPMQLPPPREAARMVQPERKSELPVVTVVEGRGEVAAGRQEEQISLARKGEKSLFPSRQEIVEKMAAKKLDLSKVHNKHKNAPVPRLSLDEIKALDSDASSDEDEDKSSRSPNLERGRQPPAPQAGKVQLAKAKPSHPPAKKTGPKKVCIKKTTEKVEVTADERRPTQVSARKMLDWCKDNALRGEGHFSVIGRGANPKVLDKVKREGGVLNRSTAAMRIQTMWRRRKSKKIVGAGKDIPSEKATQKLTEAEYGRKMAAKAPGSREESSTWEQAKEKLLSAVQEVNAAAGRTDDSFVCIPLAKYEALQAEHTAATKRVPVLRDIPQYPGVRGNFDGLWRLWLQQEVQNRQISPQLMQPSASGELEREIHSQDLPDAQPRCVVYGPEYTAAAGYPEQRRTYRVLLRQEERIDSGSKGVRAFGETSVQTTSAAAADAGRHVKPDEVAFSYDVVRIHNDSANGRPLQLDVQLPEKNGAPPSYAGITSAFPQQQVSYCNEYPTLLNSGVTSPPPIPPVDNVHVVCANRVDGSLPNYPYMEPDLVPSPFEVFWQRAKRDAYY